MATLNWIGKDAVVQRWSQIPLDIIMGTALPWLVVVLLVAGAATAAFGALLGSGCGCIF